MQHRLTGQPAKQGTHACLHVCTLRHVYGRPNNQSRSILTCCDVPAPCELGKVKGCVQRAFRGHWVHICKPA